MTDTFIEVQGDFAPAQTSDFASDENFSAAVDAVGTVEAAPALPNGFLKMGLAPELLRAVEDLGYTQPTLVQDKVIPLALPTDDTTGKAKAYIDLMVSSQTGSGKTAAFL
ncbi:MAG: DEAD/DEAH box helicase, partial [Ramlibacter sp.]